jgi:signal transduction histidine kinase
MPRLRLKTKLVLAITGMVFVLVVTLSALFVSQLLRQRLNGTADNADFIAHQIYQAAKQALETDLSSTRLDLSDPSQARNAIAEVLQSDEPANTLLQSIVGYDPEVYDACVVDKDGRALLHSDVTLLDKPVPRRESLESLRQGRLLDQIRAVYGPARVYDVTLPIQRESKPFAEIRVGISSLFLKNEIKPLLDRAVLFSGIAVLMSLLLAAVLSNIALRPLEKIGRRLDTMTAETAPAPETEDRATDEFGAVNTKIDRLGRQISDVRGVFTALKENLDQIMATLQDGLMLFTNDGKVVLVSASAERFIGRPRGELLGYDVEQIFDDSTRLGRIVLDAFALRQSVPQRTIEIEAGRHMQIALDFIEERGQNIGALLTMRDAESVQRIENEIELSRRLAAIGRLTSGVAHEVKNPINAVVIHLEILRERLLQIDPDTRRHIDIIASEIHRLDRVVKALVDFTRPVEMDLKVVDLRSLAELVVALTRPEAVEHNVKMFFTASSRPLNALIDEDLIKQALLNIIINGVQAMPDGGEMHVSVAGNSERATIEIRDTGVGIPAELRDRIFNLYFTTKKSGSGIGLAMAYRVLQMHNGSLDFESEVGKGTVFQLVLPVFQGSVQQRETAMESRGVE